MLDGVAKAKRMKPEKFQSDFRRCPRHKSTLALVIDDYFKHVSVLHWKCDQCCGLWSEEFFYRQVEQSLPDTRGSTTFVFPCPHCDSVETYHACVVGCCEMHGCGTCNQGFELEVEVVERASWQPVDENRTTSEILNWAGIAAVPLQGFFVSEITLIGRTCQKHSNTALQFAVRMESRDFIPNDERYRYAWACADCGSAYFDYTFERALYLSYRPICLAQIECPVCYFFKFESQADYHFARCLTCKSLVRLKAKKYGGDS